MAKYGNTPSFLALSCVGAMAFASGAHAQDNGQGQALGGVTVTDTAIDDSSIKVEKPESPKYVRPLLDTPQTITVIGNQTIQKQNLLTLRDVLSTVPGITFGAGEGGGGYGDSINLRGQSANTDISIDGVRDSAQYSRTDPFNLEQIEVTNGANSVYGGSGAIGGNINLVTKRPKADSETLVQGGIGVYPAFVALIVGVYMAAPEGGGLFRPDALAMGWLLWAAQTLMIIVLGGLSLLLIALKRTPAA
jgi:catecholate siderophore receptor